MYRIDPSRTDLVDEFMANPDGPYSPELALVVNRLRIMPFEDRHVIVCTKRGEEWMLARIPAARGATVELFDDRRYGDYDEAVREVFLRRWETVTGRVSDRDREAAGRTAE